MYCAKNCISSYAEAFYLRKRKGIPKDLKKTLDTETQHWKKPLYFPAAQNWLQNLHLLVRGYQ